MEGYLWRNLVGEMESLKIIDEVNLVRNRPIMNPKMNKNVYWTGEMYRLFQQFCLVKNTRYE